MCHQTPNPMKNAAKRLLKSLSPAVFKISYMLSWSTVQGKIDHCVQNWSKWQDENVLYKLTSWYEVSNTINRLYSSQKNDTFPSKSPFLATRWCWTWSRMHQIKKWTPLSITNFLRCTTL